MPSSGFSGAAYGQTTGTLVVAGQNYWSGQSHGWRYLAQRIDGSGVPGVFVHNELPLINVKITDVLSGPVQMSADISPAFKDLVGSDGRPLLHEWATIIYAECDGVIRAGCILVNTAINGSGSGSGGAQGSTVTLDCSGFAGYPKGMAYPGNDQFVQVDALDIVRWIWDKIQADNGSNLLLQVDQGTETGSLMGLPVSGDGTSTNTNGPYTLTWWGNTDLGSDIDKLAQAAPFEYHERHVWAADYSTVDHFLDFGSPSIGRRRTDLRFVYGENVQTIPQPSDDGTDFSNHVLFLGAGTGSAMVRAESRIADGRLRRMAVVTDSAITDQATAANSARLEMAQRQQLLQLTQVYIRNHPNAPVGSFGVGDEIRVQAETDWATFDIWCRVIQLQTDPDLPDMMLATLIRSDWVL